MDRWRGNESSRSSSKREKKYSHSEEYHNEEGKQNTDLADKEVHFLEATVIVESSNAHLYVEYLAADTDRKHNHLKLQLQDATRISKNGEGDDNIQGRHVFKHQAPQRTHAVFLSFHHECTRREKRKEG